MSHTLYSIILYISDEHCMTELYMQRLPQNPYYIINDTKCLFYNKVYIIKVKCMEVTCMVLHALHYHHYYSIVMYTSDMGKKWPPYIKLL